MRRRVIVFDVNETLLDMSVLDDVFGRIFGDPSSRADWFKQMLQLAFVSNIVRAYSDFSTIGRAALTMVAERRGTAVSDTQAAEIAAVMRSLPAHPDVVASLEALRRAEFRLAALANSTPVVLEAQLRNAGIHDYFQSVLSVDAVRAFKPDRATYELAARTHGVAIAELRLVAAHDWDIWGALEAGAAAAFIARKNQVLAPPAPRPDIVASSLDAVAAAIIREDS